MRTTFQRLILTSALVIVATGGMNFAEAKTVTQTVTQTLTDVRQETQIWTTYALNPYLRASDLKVSVQDGKATLSGTVEEGVSKDLAKQIALGVSGIKDVDNNIAIKADYSPAESSDARSFGDFIDDASITAAVKSKLLWSRYADGLATDVDTKNGKVSLTGTADSAAARELAERLAKNTRGVKSVDNQLTLNKSEKSENAKKHEKSGKSDGDDKNKKETAKADTAKTGHEISDTWITTKVKSTYMYSSNVNSSNISVTTDKGVVDLSGTVGSGAERDLAIEIAQNLRGVNSVTSKNLKF